MIEATEFDLVATIAHEGRVSIEASAGTGKTYALAALATRYVAENEVTIDQILVVTFGRLAARELREKIRARISYTSRALAGLIPVEEKDDVTDHLASFDRALHQKRLERALLDFDTSTITTIHSFAQQIRSALGTFARLDLDAVLKDDTDEIVNEVVADVLSGYALRDELGDVAQLQLNESVKSTLVRLAKTALNNPGIPILPNPMDHEIETVNAAFDAAMTTRQLLDHVLEEVSSRRRLRRTLSYDDVLTQLRSALGTSTHAINLLRRRFPVALVDEFQDTDQVQWDVLEQLFGSIGSRTRLIVVGDPKQAIYGFRGANVYSYLGATLRDDVEHHRLSVNFRSDGALLTGLDRLLTGATFGHSEIGFQPVLPSDDHRLRRLVGPSDNVLPGLSIRTAIGPDLPRNSRDLVATEVARNAIATDLASCVHNLLNGVKVPLEAPGKFRSVRPNDIAVLVARNAEAMTMQRTLRARGIPAVIRQGLNVLQTEAESQWRLLMYALARPSDPDRARRVALGWFFDHDVRRIAGTNDDALQEIQETLVRWSDSLSRFGIADFCSVVWSESNVMQIVLGRHNGDRNMTDLNQIAALLHRGGLLGHPTPEGVLRALDELNEIHRDDPDEDVLSQQIESEALAVQIMTIHKSKGLQFPVVCVPSMWHAVSRGDFYQDFMRNERVLAVDRTKQWPSPSAFRLRQRLALKDAIGEDLRLLYVALTRAEHQTIVWWTRVKDNQHSGLARVLFAQGAERIDDETGDIASFDIPPNDLVVGSLRARFGIDVESDEISIDEIGTEWPSESRWLDQEANAGETELEVAKLKRVFSSSNRRWSFSAMIPLDRSRPLVNGARFDPTDESLGDTGANDEPTAIKVDDDEPVLGNQDSDLALGYLSGGTKFGTLVHEILQEVDFAELDLERALAEVVERRLRWRGLVVDQSQLIRGLKLVIETPLGRMFAERRLRDFARGDRLDELGFELRLGHGRHIANVRDIGKVLTDHLSQADPVRGWAERLRGGLFDEELAGHLTGSIDLVVRVRDLSAGASQSRYVLADYKTNTLSDLGRLPRSVDYLPTRLARAMEVHHYPLQAVLYAVALHRYLRWRVPGYDPKVHFGGAAYLFLRGMQGPGTPLEDGHPCGVFAWEFSPALLGDLSDTLDASMELS